MPDKQKERWGLFADLHGHIKTRIAEAEMVSAHIWGGESRCASFEVSASRQS